MASLRQTDSGTAGGEELGGSIGQELQSFEQQSGKIDAFRPHGSDIPRGVTSLQQRCDDNVAIQNEVRKFQPRINICSARVIHSYVDKSMKISDCHIGSLKDLPRTPVLGIKRRLAERGDIPEGYEETSEDIYMHEEKMRSFNIHQTFIKQLLEAPNRIHCNGIIHGDLKPENILFSLDGELIKVSDFGIGKKLRDSKSKIAITSRGTDGYRAPETYSSVYISISADILQHSSTQEVNLNEGTFERPHFGSVTNTKHVEANKIEKATIIHHHHNYSAEDSSISSNPTNDRQDSRKALNAGIPKGYKEISEDIYMYTEKPMMKGTNVYRGFQVHITGQRQGLAIKKITPCQERSIREVQHLVNLSPHPNVVRILRSKVDEELYIVMELCKDQNLQDVLNENKEKMRPFDMNKAMSFAKQLVKAIEHIHRNGIIHGDLKPESIPLSLDGELIKVSDFGISKKLRDSKSKIAITSCGTDSYRAPKTYSSDHISKSADILQHSSTQEDSVEVEEVEKKLLKNERSHLIQVQSDATPTNPSGSKDSLHKTDAESQMEPSEAEEEDWQFTPSPPSAQVPLSPVARENTLQKMDWESSIERSAIPFRMEKRTSGGSSSSEEYLTAESESDTETVEPSTFFAKGELKFDGYGNFHAKFRPEQNSGHEFDGIPKNCLVTLFRNQEFRIGNKIEFRMTCKCEDDPPKTFHFGNNTSVFIVNAPFLRAGQTITRVLRPPPFPRPRLVVECCVLRDGTVITDCGEFRIPWPDTKESESSGVEQSCEVKINTLCVQGDSHFGGSNNTVDRSERRLEPGP